MTMKGMQIHRFREAVAVNVPGQCETAYLTVADARALARAINAAARDIAARKFAESAFTTFNRPVKPGAQFAERG
jgi:hypothetical protein